MENSANAYANPICVAGGSMPSANPSVRGRGRPRLYPPGENGSSESAKRSRSRLSTPCDGSDSNQAKKQKMSISAVPVPKVVVMLGGGNGEGGMGSSSTSTASEVELVKGRSRGRPRIYPLCENGSSDSAKSASTASEVELVKGRSRGRPRIYPLCENGSSDSNQTTKQMLPILAVPVMLGGGNGGGGMGSSSASTESKKAKTPKSPVQKVGRTLLSELAQPKIYAVDQFLVERGDFWTNQISSMYMVKLGNLLLRYDASLELGVCVFRPTNKYQALNYDLYRPVDVVIMGGTTKNPTAVRIVSGEAERPCYDRTSESEQIADVFHIYYQAVATQALGLPVEEIQQTRRLANALQEVDTLIAAGQEEILTTVAWDEAFKAALDRLPLFKVEELVRSPQKGVDRLITLVGMAYDPETMKKLSDVEEQASHCFSSGDLIPVLIYHSLRHFKYQLFVESTLEIGYQRKKHKDDVSVMNACLQNGPRFYHWLNRLLDPVLKSGINFEVEKTEVQQQ